MAKAQRVAVVGAAGETGTSIVNALLKDGNFEVTALARPTSVDNPKNRALASRGVKIIAADLKAPIDELVSMLKDIDIVVSAIGPWSQHDQIPLATAAKKAGVKRFLPCAFITVAPPGGVMSLTDVKEEVYTHLKEIGLPYTVVDVGWWYQFGYPRLPSGKIDYSTQAFINLLVGDGNTPTALTDLRDIGSYVARIIVDERTENKYVLAYNEVWKPNDIWTLLEKMSGESIPRKYTSEQELQAEWADVQESLKKDPNTFTFMRRAVVQYQISWGVRGDNTPEMAKKLGYITTKELYPDMKYCTLEEYLHEVLAGKAKGAHMGYEL